jgi:hypothetical protein
MRHHEPDHRNEVIARVSELWLPAIFAAEKLGPISPLRQKVHQE